MRAAPRALTPAGRALGTGRRTRDNPIVVAPNKLPLLLRELAYWRARLTFTPATRALWDDAVARFETIPVFDDDQGIERGWIVGVLVVMCLENGAGQPFRRQVMRLADSVAARKRWSELDYYAFKILIGEALLRSYALETPVPQDNIDSVQKSLTALRARLAENDVTMPVDWRDMDPDVAQAIILNQSRPRSGDS